MNSPVKIACIQMHAEYGALDANLAKVRKLVKEACDNGANFLVLPEVFNQGMIGSDRATAFSLAESIPDGKTTQTLLELATENKVYICGSFIELDGPDLYNTAILVGQEGFIGKYRKLHPCEDEVYYIEPGNLGIPVFHTPIGRIALLICLDGYYPETYRIAALQGADIVCVLFNAKDVHESRKMPEGMYTAITSLCLANALSNHIFVVGCNREGECDGYMAAGQSVIANQWGAPVVPIAPHDKEVILYAEVDLADSRRKYFHPTNSRLANRRTDVYSTLLGYNPEKYKDL